MILDLYIWWTTLWARRRVRKECERNGPHLKPRLLYKEGRWDNETEYTAWANNVCDHCGASFFQYLDNFGNPKGSEFNRT